MDNLSETITPRQASPMHSRMPATNLPNSSGSISPASSDTVSVAAPASFAAKSALSRKPFSERVASRAVNSTSGHSALALLTVSLIFSSIFSGLRCMEYSMPTTETGYLTFRRGLDASLTAENAFSHSPPVTGTETTAFLVCLAMVLISISSLFSSPAGQTQITSTFTSSRSLAHSSRRPKLIPALADRVDSARYIFLILHSCYTKCPGKLRGDQHAIPPELKGADASHLVTA